MKAISEQMNTVASSIESWTFPIIKLPHLRVDTGSKLDTIKQWENSLALTPAWHCQSRDIRADQDIKIKAIKIILLTFSTSDVNVHRLVLEEDFNITFLCYHSPDSFIFPAPLNYNHKNLCWVTKTCVTIKYMTRDEWGWISSSLIITLVQLWWYIYPVSNDTHSHFGWY